ncbi:MAG: phosphotransferase [Burkholderiales bacterium]|nr:MAG: phosphotransferase [Burkholderiales bacterium]
MPGALGHADYALTPASADASFRRYFRASYAGGSAIAMDAPPAREDCRPFVKVAGLLREAGVHAPQVLAQDLQQGFLLLTDLGNTTYLQVLNEDNADRLFADALGALLAWQRASRPEMLPAYDEALLRRELALFPEWYLGHHLGLTLDVGQQATLERLFALILENNLAQARVFVHRDFMPRNLMVCEPNPGVIDFQDAVFGPISYDLASLFRDAFISWDEARVLDWCIRYWEQARAAGLPVPADFAAFYRDLEWMGLQRHLKVLGIFARLKHRDGKANYLADAPRFLGYVRHTATRYRELAPLARLLDDIEGRVPQKIYTF